MASVVGTADIDMFLDFLTPATITSPQGYMYADYELCDGFYKHVNLFVNNAKLDREKERANRLLRDLKDPVARAFKTVELGSDALQQLERDLEKLTRDSTERLFERFSNMIRAVYNLMEIRGGMRLEMFQVELMRGFYIGIAANQFKGDLFKYKHKILELTGLATAEISAFNPMFPSKITAQSIDEIFDEYGKNYTLALAPRQCGKTEMMSILLATMILFLDIEIVVQAQHKVMSESVYNRVMNVMMEIQAAPWFPPEHRFQKMNGTTDTREFIYDEDYKGVTRVHFLSSSPNVSMAFIIVSNLTEMVILVPCEKEEVDVYVCASVKMSPVVFGKVKLYKPTCADKRMVLGTDYDWTIPPSTADSAQECDTVSDLERAAGLVGTLKGGMETLLKHVVFFDFDPRKSPNFNKTYLVESKIYNLLLELHVPIAYHHIIFRRLCDEIGLVSEYTPHCKDVMKNIVLTLMDEYGTPLASHEDVSNFSKFSRPRAVNLLYKASKGLVKKEPIAPVARMDDPADIQRLIGTINMRLNMVSAGGGVFWTDSWRTTFKDLTSYCLGENNPKLEAGGMPPRPSWSGVPLLLMDDSEKEKKKFRYVVLGGKELDELPRGCYSEVFLEGHPVTVVNFDIDRPMNATESPDLVLSQMDQILAVFTKFLHETAEKKFFGEFPIQKIGEVAVYVRKNAFPEKFSARFVWFPPYELCFRDMRYLSEFTQELEAVVRRQRNFFVYEKATPDGRVTEACAVDAQPFHVNKSCRLPNALKKTNDSFGKFEYVKSYNVFIKSEKNYNSLRIGISRSVLGSDRPSIGGKFIREALSVMGAQESSLIQHHYKSEQVSEERVAWCSKLLTATWGPVKMNGTMSGNVRFVPLNKVTCPLHGRDHKNAGVSVTLTSRYVYPKCFHSDPPFINVPVDSFIHMIEQNGAFVCTA